tara:strand:+ start:516 stop:2018 length:1503 start_codon:yes stop_codon:yes gene_type:complete
MQFEIANPNPEFLIKSIAEQGYTLETALADLIDNSISAGADKIEILISMEDEPFTLYLADNGDGMDEAKLRQSMEFPSDSPEHSRSEGDLGRFGLGMKTASFSQTRHFSVFSKKKSLKEYAGRTWDVEKLKEGEWNLGINSRSEITNEIERYQNTSNDYLNSLTEFEPNTIVVWRGLYKFEDYMEESAKKIALKTQLNEITCEHLSLVFHRFMERAKSALEIRVNNKKLTPFNPFPAGEPGVRKIEPRQKSFRSDHIKIDGIVLPSKCIDEVKNSATIWTTRNRGLLDMEGIYVYRADRIILFGGWNGLTRKAPRLQLARMRVDVGNKVDHLLHLNVAKSQIVIPHDLRPGFESYIHELKTEAEREFYNRGIKRIEGDNHKLSEALFTKVPSNKGIILELNSSHPATNHLLQTMDRKQTALFRVLSRSINTAINRIKQTHQPEEFIHSECDDQLSMDDLKSAITTLHESGMPETQIKQLFATELGYSKGTLPDDLFATLK